MRALKLTIMIAALVILPFKVEAAVASSNNEEPMSIRLAEFQLPPGFLLADEVASAPEGSPLATQKGGKQPVPSVISDTEEAYITPLTVHERKLFKPNVHKQLEKVTKAAESALYQIETVHAARNALARIPERGFSLIRLGTFGEFRLRIAKFVNYFGVHIEGLDAAIALKEAGYKLTEIDTSKFRHRVTNKTFNLFLESNPGLTKGMVSNIRILELIEKVALRNVEQATFYKEYARVNGEVNTAPRAWGRFKEENQLFDKDLNKFKENLRDWKDYLDPNYTKKKDSGGAGVDLIRSQAENAIRAGKDPKAVRSLFKELTGEDF